MISARQTRTISKWLRPQLVSQPKVEPVSGADFTSFRRLNSSNTDAGTAVADKLKSARARVEKFTRRALVCQVWDAYLDLPPGDSQVAGILARYFSTPEGLEIPRPPLINLIGCYLTDQNAMETTVDPTVYWVSRFKDPARLAQRSGGVWPDSLGRTFETFRIRFSAGYLTPFTAIANSSVLTAPNHGYSIGDQLNISNRDGALPAGLIDSVQDYYVVAANQTAGTLSLSTTPGGAAIAPTDVGTGSQFLGVLPDALRRAILLLATADIAPERGGLRGAAFAAADESTLPVGALELMYDYRAIRI